VVSTADAAVSRRHRQTANATTFSAITQADQALSHRETRKHEIIHAVMKTARLDIRQWLICTAVALLVVAVAEIRRAVHRGPVIPVSR